MGQDLCPDQPNGAVPWKEGVSRAPPQLTLALNLWCLDWGLVTALADNFPSEFSKKLSTNHTPIPFLDWNQIP